MIDYKTLKHSDNGMPTWDAFLGPILQVTSTKNLWKRQELIQSVLNEINLPEELMTLRYSSKYHDLVAADRVNWALSDKDWFEKQNSDLSETLIAKLRKTDPYQFEEMMVKLLNAMGYKGTNGQSVVTQKSNDGGIDGIINQDPLGLRTVYIQVKRYAENNVVGSPEINSFFGALRRKQADRGVFITTSSFTKDAQEAAKQLNIALVDGEMLTNLMIQYKVGVQVSQTYELYDIDDDFFEQ